MLRKSGKLKAPEFYKLCQGLQTYAHLIQEKKLNRVESASMLSIKLNMEVSPSNLDTAANAVGLVLWAKRQSPRRVKHLVIRAVIELYEKLGEPVPEYLTKEPTES